VVVLVLALMSGLADHASAQGTADTLPLGEALRLARDANPMLQSMRLRADAAAEQIPQAGAWSNPVLAVGLRNRPIDGFGTDQPMTMNVIELRQQIPWPGKLGYAKERATHVAAAESLEVDELEAQLLARVKSVYYRLAYVDRALDIMRETRELLRNFLDVSSALYAVGSGLQQDVLQAQIAIAQMTEDITVMEQDRVATAARLNALLGRYATIPIGLLELSGPGGPLLPVDSLMLVAAEARPALAAARRRVEAADAGYRAARRRLYPDFMVTLGYGQRPQYTDFVTLMVGVSVPLFAGSRQLPLRREMEAVKSAEEARARDLYNETFARLTELRAQAERARNLSSLYAGSVLPQARAAVESALSAYRVGRVDYMTLVANEMTVNRYEIETVRLAADYHRALAELEALVGTELGGGQ
jgi:outer membrane protein TolC